MASNLPTFPRIVFTIFEPISLIGGFLSAALFPAWFVNAQLPFVLVGEVAGEAVPEGVPATAPAVSTPAAAFTWDDYSHPPMNPAGLTVALQLGNTYLLLALLGVAVLTTTREIRVVRAYLLALWVADMSHIGITCYGLGLHAALDVLNWNAMAWGNIGITVSSFTLFYGLAR
ncbi:hypothetical protein HOO65_090198 [Ceratocystis lukuohia]|uniref:DUF7704 domain-containing protein n=1 Tax=Ceratocystis lukuohia TaxID=2019550 RepID=A0ABR4M9F4_9PEZI